MPGFFFFQLNERFIVKISQFEITEGDTDNR